VTISQPRSLLLGLSLVLAACGGGDLTLPPDGAAANIEVVTGNGQSARVGSTLPESLVVKVTDTQDRPVADANVVFEFTADGSGASPASVSTDADGRAASLLLLGTRVGPVSGTVKVPVQAGVTPVQATISATAFSDNANGIALVSGNDQTGPVGTQLPAPLVVAVTDAFGNPISGVTVEWSVGSVGSSAGGSVSSATTVTDDNGQTSVTRTLGPTAGVQTTVATAAGLAGSPVTFTHTATAGNAARVIVVSGNGQSATAGTKLQNALVVQLLDDQNNPISGRAVTWLAGTGSASPETSTTDGNGQARTEWTLGPNPGPNTLTAVVSGVGNASFNATGTKIASTTGITSHTPEPSIVGTPVTVGVTVNGAGGIPTGQVTVSGDGAVPPCTINLASGSGSCQITLTQPGNRDLTATYAGDTRFSGSSGTQKHQVNPAPNAAPVARDDPYSTNEDATLTVNAANGVLNNDTDADSPVLTAIKDSDPAHGTLSLASDGSFTYTPVANYSGGDSFTYHANDGSNSSASATVTITVNSVNDVPVAADDGPYATPGGDAALTIAAPGVLANDSDPDGTAPTAGNASIPGKGAVTLNPDGSFTYTPNPGESGLDSFTYDASDGTLASTATVTISITTP
jgi:VCBS repeat-containing protein